MLVFQQFFWVYYHIISAVTALFSSSRWLQAVVRHFVLIGFDNAATLAALKSA